MTPPRHHGRSGSKQLITYAIFGGTFSFIFARLFFPGSLVYVLKNSDFGNAIAALVAVSGYILEHLNTRKAQQLEAQMDQVTQQSHQLLIPITTQFHSLLQSMLQFIDKHTAEAETFIASEYDDPNHGINMTKRFNKTPLFEPGTSLRHESSIGFVNEVILQLRVDRDLASSGIVFNVAAPRELPKFLHKALEECEKPKSKLWKSYESFIRNEFLPAVDRIAEIIDEHGHLLEPVPPEKLAKVFGTSGTGFGQSWEVSPRMIFYSMWLSYARTWKTIVAMWDEDEYEEIRPFTPFPSGLLLFNMEAQGMVADEERKLVGRSQMQGHDQWKKSLRNKI